MTALFAKEFESSNVEINSVCPDWVMTDMGHENLPEEGVGKIQFLLDFGIDVPSGSFFSGGKPVPW